jgi:hypothetical protein
MPQVLGRKPRRCGSLSLSLSSLSLLSGQNSSLCESAGVPLTRSACTWHAIRVPKEDRSDGSPVTPPSACQSMGPEPSSLTCQQSQVGCKHCSTFSTTDLGPRYRRPAQGSAPVRQGRPPALYSTDFGLHIQSILIGVPEPQCPCLRAFREQKPVFLKSLFFPSVCSNSFRRLDGATLFALAARVLGLTLDLAGWLAAEPHQMAGLVGTTVLADLTPVAAEAGAAEGDIRWVYTWEGLPGNWMSKVRSYPPSDGGAPRLVAMVGTDCCMGVWDTGTGAFLAALQGPEGAGDVDRLVTYQRPSDGRPRIAAGFRRGHLCIWDGDHFQVLHARRTSPEGGYSRCLAVYEEPTSGRTRLVTG